MTKIDKIMKEKGRKDGRKEERKEGSKKKIIYNMIKIRYRQIRKHKQ